MNTTYIPHPSDFDRLDTAAPAAASTSTQRTPEWYAARRGRFTGSNIWKLMVDPRTSADKAAGKLSETAMTYIREVLAESVTGITPEVSSAAMEWGIMQEQFAVMAYQDITGETIRPADFVPMGDLGGGSPDGYIDPFGIVEIKCPYNSGVHLENLLFFAANPTADDFKSQYREYYWQIQNNLLVTVREECIFISYDPRFPTGKQIGWTVIRRNPHDIGQLVERFTRAIDVMAEMRLALNLFA